MNSLQLLSKRTFKLYVVLIVQVTLSIAMSIKQFVQLIDGTFPVLIIYNLIGFIFIGIDIFLIVVFYKVTKTIKKLVSEDSGDAYLKYSKVINYLNSFLMIIFILSLVVVLVNILMLFMI